MTDPTTPDVPADTTSTEPTASADPSEPSTDLPKPLNAKLARLQKIRERAQAVIANVDEEEIQTIEEAMKTELEDKVISGGDGSVPPAVDGNPVSQGDVPGNGDIGAGELPPVEAYQPPADSGADTPVDSGAPSDEPATLEPSTADDTADGGESDASTETGDAPVADEPAPAEADAPAADTEPVDVPAAPEAPADGADAGTDQAPSEDEGAPVEDAPVSDTPIADALTNTEAQTTSDAVPAPDAPADVQTDAPTDTPTEGDSTVSSAPSEG